MTEQLISELENAARIFLASPNVVTKEQRSAAEKIIMNFRKTKTPYSICREILEKSTTDYLKFEAAELLKKAVIREWTFMSDSDKSSLLQYLLQFITRNMSSYVQNRILDTIVIIIKRSSIDDNGRGRASILQEVENLLINGEHSKKMLGCSVISKLMQEYASTVKSTDVGLPWEVHFKAKKQFEATDLKRIFQLCIYLLSEVVKNDPPYSDNVMELTESLLKIIEGVLTWGFISPILPKRLIGIYESVYQSDEAPALKLTTSWSEIILNPDLLPLMFETYWKVREMKFLPRFSLSCLVQLASLSGGIVASDETRLKYLHNYLMMFFKLVSNMSIKEEESVGISNIVKNLTIFYVHDFSKLPKTVQDTLIEEFTKITCHFCDCLAMENVAYEYSDYFVSFANMLRAWTSIIQEFGNSSDNVLLECSKQMFNKYVQCYLAPPDGNRKKISPVDYNETEDGIPSVNKQRTKCKSELQTVGMIGRLVPGHAFPVLFKLLEARIETLVHFVGTWISVPKNSILSPPEHEALDKLYEDIYWIILISGHVLCMESDGETPMIPSEIMQYSIDQHNRHETTLDATLKALIAIESKIAVPENFDQCDHTIRIVFNVMKLCTVEDYVVHIGRRDFLFGELGCALMWFLKRWCLSYLLPLENYYQDLSPILIGCLGGDTDSATMIMNFIIAKIQFNLRSFEAGDVLDDTVDLFCSMVGVKQKSTLLIKTESMRNLIRYFEALEPLPGNTTRGVCKGLVLAGAVLPIPQDMIAYYEIILTPFLQRFKISCLDPTYCKTASNQEEIILQTLEYSIGIVTGSQMASVEILFRFLTPVLSELPEILRTYYKSDAVVHRILEFLGQCSKYMLCYLSPLDSKKLYESSLAIVQAYVDCYQDRVLHSQLWRNNSVTEDIDLILDLLTFTLSKDCIDLCTNTNNEEINITAADVAIFGLNFIMPLVTFDMLSCPQTCTRYYRLLVLLNDIYPEKICNLFNLYPDLERTLLQTIEMGLTKFGGEAVQSCLDFIQGMATYIFKNNMVHSHFSQSLKPFLKQVMDLTLTNQIDSDSLSSASTCIYALMCCYQEEYHMLVQSIIQSQTDPQIAERLTTAFHNLTEMVAMNCERQPKLRFRDNFDKFIANVACY